MDAEKQAVLDKILKDKERGVRLVPAPGYSHKMQTIRSSSLDAARLVHGDSLTPSRDAK